MKFSDAKAALQNDGFSLVEIRKNPSHVQEYIVLLYRRDGKSFMLAEEDDSVVSSPDLNFFALLLKDLGFKSAKVYF